MTNFERRFPKPKEYNPPNPVGDVYPFLERFHRANREGWLEALKWVKQERDDGDYDYEYLISKEIEELEKE